MVCTRCLLFFLRFGSRFISFSFDRRGHRRDAGFNRYKSLAEVRRYINPTSAVDPSAAAGKKEIDIPKIKPLTQKELVQVGDSGKRKGWGKLSGRESVVL